MTDQVAAAPGPLDPISLGAAWITSAEHRATGVALPVLATVVDVPAGVRLATLHIATLGVLRATIDGRPVSSDVLEPGYADWRTEAEHVVWDVTALLPPGRHVLRLDLGGGMYRSLPDERRWVKVITDLGDIAVAAALELDGEPHTLTGGDWRATTGATLHSGFIGGEDYDARLEPSASTDGIAAWPRAVPAVVPAGLRLVAKATPPIRVVATLPAESITRVGKALVVDFGQNAAGWPVIELPADAHVRLRPAELLLEDGGVDVRTEGWGPVFHTVTTQQPMTWRPSYMYNGLRYLEVLGLDELDRDSVQLEVLAAAVPDASGFTSSDERLDAIWRITRHAIRSNMFSVFTDCPQREKLGYLEQIHLLHDLLVRTYACEPILDRMLELAIGAQRPDGSIGLYAPEWQEFPDPWRGDPNWGGTVVLLAHARHRATGDTAPLARSLEAMLRYTDFLLADRDPDGIARYGLGDFNGASVRKFRNVPLVSTATLHKLLRRTADAACLLGETATAERLLAAAEEVAMDFAREFCGRDGSIGGNGIAELVFALDAGLAPADTIDRIDEQIRAAGHVLDVGEVAMAFLVEQLATAGRHETLLGITRVTDAPSYGYMLAHGATTLTETWDGPTFGFSQNHFMNGAIATWFHEHIVGIRQRERTIGWEAPLIAPAPVGDLTHASGWYDAPGGRIAVEWRIDAGRFCLTGTARQATVRMPSGAEHAVTGAFDLQEPIDR
ncbi:family 78 glycoside hydrolase catalytic domain [Agrococcus baldri]|uniref:alpha-L-rhamnosidase n=1 Tax=Agrococcus baldri TaxID=153730 RepID=A0AA87RAC9_9MICO|nr:family 78 glycoside hydrolase catalytic domain [Agrococcus baldri]GEK79221.1 hypothetical protein ABA31_05720 [Agrococcus baldri]